MEQFGITGRGDVYMAYLPLAHIMEMAGELMCYSLGMTVGYGSPHTLTPTGVKMHAGGMGDAQVLKPTMMVFAPAVLDKVRPRSRRA
jgi:long-subunit acyl-CoA synthetase (AMP-forming)